ncbi:PREDICTED: uncharacterized protein LOC108569350 [Nicrophorus vespilloides]|uniref:Uncharacterized protein LOC108569350 n=1 Tax=Nicrophorus vespilloides TaxID=110193 RepID=A0ABM1NHQ8_NICVS|nr:PREDICTED: uncharacterized protein LOC108569350 [Nicrophorus vespilloides]
MEVNSGLPQGSVLGHHLWNLSYDGVLRIKQPAVIIVIGYADDLAVVVVAKTEEELARRANLYRSNSREVTLKDVERETSGEFKCEVSADAPLFHTEIRAAHLLVADIPDEGPVLRTDVQKVAPGAKIRANCTTPGSYPPMNVTWFINDVEVHAKHGIQIDDSVNRYDALPGLESVRSTISIRAVQDLFKNGKMRLRCLATMFSSLYRRAKENEIQEDAPLMALIMVPTTHSNEGINSGPKHSVSNKMLHFSMYTFILIYMSMNIIGY